MSAGELTLGEELEGDALAELEIVGAVDLAHTVGVLDRRLRLADPAEAADRGRAVRCEGLAGPTR